MASHDDNLSMNSSLTENYTLSWDLASTTYLTDLSGKTVSLKQLATGRVAFVFLRRFDCATCYSYVILFSHLQPILKRSGIRIVFISCHETLREVQVFLRSFAFWLRQVNHKEGSQVESMGGVLPGEIYLDVQRKSYKFFGLAEELSVWQSVKELGKTFMMKMLGHSHIANRNRNKVDDTMYSTKDKAMYYVWEEMNDQVPMANSVGAYFQSPGIVVVNDRQVVYRYIVRDRNKVVPEGSPELANALECSLEEVDGLEETVAQGFEEFLDAMDSRPKSAQVPTDELIFLDQIGSGVESQVYRCKWMGQIVAVKCYQSEEAEDANTSFANEAAFLMSLRHRNVVQVLGFGYKVPDKLFMVSEMMDQGTLFRVLGNMDIELTEDIKRNILIDIAKGMAFLHGCNPRVIHQDLKSLNVLVADDWTCKISDFGIAKLVQRGKKKSRRDSLQPEEDDEEFTMHSGTRQWMAPEQLVDGGCETGVKTDMYAFGVIMWEVATRKRPWKSVPSRRMSEQVVSGDRPPVDLRDPWPARFTKAVEQCWHQDPEKRPKFAEVVKMLKNLPVPSVMGKTI